MAKFETPGLRKSETPIPTDDELAEYFDSLPIAFENRDCEPEIAALEALFSSYESMHDLEALHAIHELTPEVASQHPVREPARIGLNAITEKLNLIDTKTNITDERWNALCERYARLSRAVGIINRNVLDHTRTQIFKRTPRA